MTTRHTTLYRDGCKAIDACRYDMDEPASKAEHEARRRLVLLCVEIALEYGCRVGRRVVEAGVV
jgi:hypothetical protein